MRPYRNPQTARQRLHNQEYIEQQMLLPQEQRQADYIFPAAMNLSDWDGWNAGLQIAMVDGLVFNPGNDIRPRVRREELESNVKLLKMYPELNLDKLVSGNVIARDIKLPPFKIDYDSHEQIQQKLLNTIILIKELPFYVRSTVDMGKGKYALVVSSGDANMPGQFVVKYDDVKDCRGIAPGYYMYRGGAFWIYRIPERQNSQGMHQRNMQAKAAGTGSRGQSASHNFLLAALSPMKDIQYAGNLDELLVSGANTSIRLSNHISLYQTNKKGAPVGVEYCGRPLGLIVNGAVKVMDKNDLRPSWIHKDLHKVSLVMGA